MAGQSSGFDKMMDWLVAGAPGSDGGINLIQAICGRLEALGFPLDWCEIHIKTLHPDVAGVAVTWRPNRPVCYRATSYHGDKHSGPIFPPVAEAMETGNEVRAWDVALQALTGSPADQEVLTDCVVMPLTFLDGAVHTVTWATRAPARFCREHIRLLRRAMPAMARVLEIGSLKRTSELLLDTYVGNQAGSRILAGHIHRGYTETMRAAIWLSDLRGFTDLSEALPPVAVVQLLNKVFDCQIAAISAYGGEVLKFTGDGILAVFPAASDASSACGRAMNAAEEAVRSVALLDMRHLTSSNEPVRMSVALHFGELLYGNVGGSSSAHDGRGVLDEAAWGANRLDFTCVGSAVNLASRLERLSSQLGLSIVASDVFRAHVYKTWVDLGQFDFKGLSRLERVFTVEV